MSCETDVRFCRFSARENWKRVLYILKRKTMIISIMQHAFNSFSFFCFLISLCLFVLWFLLAVTDLTSEIVWPTMVLVPTITITCLTNKIVRWRFPWLLPSPYVFRSILINCSQWFAYILVNFIGSYYLKFCFENILIFRMNILFLFFFKGGVH